MDLISSETARLKGLKTSHDIELQQQKKKKELNSVTDAVKAAATEQHRTDKLREEKHLFDQECRNEAEEKKSLLQAVINEAKESGFPMPDSLIKLLNNTNGKFFLFIAMENIFYNFFFI